MKFQQRLRGAVAAATAAAAAATYYLIGEATQAREMIKEQQHQRLRAITRKKEKKSNGMEWS